MNQTLTWINGSLAWVNSSVVGVPPYFENYSSYNFVVSVQDLLTHYCNQINLTMINFTYALFFGYMIKSTILPLFENYLTVGDLAINKPVGWIKDKIDFALDLYIWCGFAIMVFFIHFTGRYFTHWYVLLGIVYLIPIIYKIVAWYKKRKNDN